jgi:hypothetical protein
MLPAPVRKKTIKFLKDWFIALITFNLTLNKKKGKKKNENETSTGKQKLYSSTL